MCLLVCVVCIVVVIVLVLLVLMGFVIMCDCLFFFYVVVCLVFVLW